MIAVIWTLGVKNLLILQCLFGTLLAVVTIVLNAVMTGSLASGGMSSCLDCFAEAVDSQKNSCNALFDLSTTPVVKIADLGNACWTVSNGLS